MPSVLISRSKAPFKVDTKVIASLAELLRTVLAPSITASLNICDPVVAMLPPLMFVVPLVSVVRLCNSSVFPTVPLNDVVPSVLRLSVNAPFNVLLNVMSPLPVLVRMVFAPRVTAS